MRVFWGSLRVPNNPCGLRATTLFSHSSFFLKKTNFAKKKKSRKNRKNGISKNPFLGIDFWSIFYAKMSHFWPPILDPFWTPILDPDLRVLTMMDPWVLIFGGEIRDFEERELKVSILGSKMTPKRVKNGSKNGSKSPFWRVLTPIFDPKPENPENGHFGVQNRRFWVILGSKMGQNRSFWVILGSKIVDFGSFWGPKCDFPQNAIFDVFFAKKRSILHFLSSRDPFLGSFLTVPNRSWTPKMGVYPSRWCILLICMQIKAKWGIPA